MHATTSYRAAARPAAEVIALLPTHCALFIHGCMATPHPLLQALAARTDLQQVRAYHLHLEGELPFVARECASRIRSISLFTGATLRSPIAEGWADYVPVFLSDIPHLIRNGNLALDAALVQLSPPDRHGFCSLGTSVDATRAAVDVAPLVLAEINEQMPRTLGDSAIHIDEVDAYMCSHRPLSTTPPRAPSEVEARIGEQVASLIEDGATLQLGIGGIPNAVLSRLTDKHDLGIHTEMFSDGAIDLIETGVVTNRKKVVYPGVTTTSFVNGSPRLVEFVRDNPRVCFLPCDISNDTALIRKNPKVVAINSAIEIDLSGQVCADSIGHSIYSGIGGQMDFMRGAALSPGGKPIIALPSTAKQGQQSRIVAELASGAGVVTTRGHVHWVITEYGTVNFHGMSLRERAEALISVAHPDFRAELRQAVNATRRFELRANSVSI